MSVIYDALRAIETGERERSRSTAHIDLAVAEGRRSSGIGMGLILTGTVIGLSGVAVMAATHFSDISAFRENSRVSYPAPQASSDSALTTAIRDADEAHAVRASANNASDHSGEAPATFSAAATSDTGDWRSMAQRETSLAHVSAPILEQKSSSTSTMPTAPAETIHRASATTSIDRKIEPSATTAVETTPATATAGEASKTQPQTTTSPRPLTIVSTGGDRNSSGLSRVIVEAPRPDPKQVDVAPRTPKASTSTAVSADPPPGNITREPTPQVWVTHSSDARHVQNLNLRLAEELRLGNRLQSQNILRQLEQIVGRDSVFMLKTRAFVQLAIDEDIPHAMELLREALARDPRDIETSINLAVAEIRIGETDLARERLKGLAQRHPNDARIVSLQKSLN